MERASELAPCSLRERGIVVGLGSGCTGTGVLADACGAALFRFAAFR